MALSVTTWVDYWRMNAAYSAGVMVGAIDVEAVEVDIVDADSE